MCSTTRINELLAALLPDWNSLDAVRHAHNVLDVTAIIFFVFLVIADVLVHVFSESKKWEKLFERIGLTVFAIAVIFEFVSYEYGKRNDALADKVITNLDTKTKQLEKRLHDASLRMDDIDKSILAQEPRAKLLSAAASELSAELAPYKNERAGLYICGREGLQNQETLDTWGAIANILSADTVAGVTGAHWKEIPTNLNFTDGCGAAGGLGLGVTVFVSKHASARTMEAANLLGQGINRALPPSTNKMPSLIDPDMAKFSVKSGFQDKKMPWVAVGLDSDLITVLIGAHP